MMAIKNGNKKNPGSSYLYTDAEAAPLIKLYERLQALPDKEYDKELKKLSFEEVHFVAAYTTYENARKGLRRDHL
jgi:hypothetical protein